MLVKEWSRMGRHILAVPQGLQVLMGGLHAIHSTAVTQSMALLAVGFTGWIKGVVEMLSLIAH